MASITQLPDIVIRASAGTGKTYQLANRYVKLLASGVAPEAILAATFTRKAAGEILERILLTLAHAASDIEKCSELAAAIELPQLNRVRCRELLARVTSRLHRLQIGTIDSFFARLASSFSLELGLPPGWRIIDDIELKRLRQESIQAMLETATDQELVVLLRRLTNGASQRTVSSMIEDMVTDCHSVFMQTSAEAWRKVPCPPQPTGDDRKWSQRVLRELAAQSTGRLQAVFEKDADMADREQWEEMLKKGILAKLIDGDTSYYRKPLDGEVLDVYQRVLQHASTVALNQLSKQTAATRDLLDKFDDEYRERQQRTGGCGFDDVARALAGQRRSDDSQRSLTQQAFRLDARLSHLLLDEFQDTSPLQWSVLRPFVEQIVLKQRQTGRAAQLNLFDESELPPSFFCVGDTKQAIYGWRGGDARIFDTLQRQLPGLTSQPLDTSYRSAQPIIDTVNRVFTRLSQHPDLGRSKPAALAWSEVFPMHTTAKKEFVGHVRLIVTPEVPDDAEKKEATLRHAAKYVEELYFSTQHVATFAKCVGTGRSTDETTPPSGDRGYMTPPTIGVLTRSNAAVGQLIFELQSLGVPASEEAGNPLTDSAAVRLILSLLRIADHPGDTIARCHVATSPIGPLLGFTNFQDDLHAARLAEMLRRQLLADGYGACVAVWSKWLAASCSQRDLNRLEQLTRIADTFQLAATLRTRDFIQLVEETKLTDPSGDRVRVMNVHLSKGLQFDIVVLPELDADLLGNEPRLVYGNDSDDPTAPPNAVCLYRHRSIQQLLPVELKQLFEQDVEQRTQEALCLLYVAMTRAIHSLQMFITPTDSQPGKTFAGVLRATLADSAAAEPDKTLFEIGDPDWRIHSRVPPSPDLSRRENALSATQNPRDAVANPDAVDDQASIHRDTTDGDFSQVDRIHFAPRLTTPVRGFERRAPSDHETSRVRRLADSLRPDNTTALERGLLFHKWFEQIEWLDSARPTAAELLAAAKSLPPLSFDPAVMLPDLFAMLDNPAISALLTRPRDPDRSLIPRVLCEHPFAFRKDDQLISGVIDRLVLWQRAGRIESADLIDFKTDDLGEAESLLQSKIETYRPQIESYRAAISQLFDVPSAMITARLAFVDSARMIHVR